MPGSFHIVVDSLIIVGSSILVSLLILGAVRAIVSHERLTPHNEVSGFVYAAIGVIYAVILGFAVVTEWEDYDDAKTNVTAEASTLGNLYRIAEGLPDSSREAIQQSVIAYADTVVNDEWDAMDNRTAPSQQAIAHVDSMWTAFYEMELSGPTEEGLYAAGLEQMDSLGEHRRERMEDAEAGVLGVVWGVLIGGAVLTVLFPCLFGVENTLVHSLIIGTLAATLGLLLFLVYDLNHPFHGDVRIGPQAFMRIIEQFGTGESTTTFRLR